MTQARPVEEDSDLAQANSPTLSRRHHILDLDDFTRDEITAVLDNTAAMAAVLKRDIRKVPALRGKTVITLFHEASTRTRVSFEQAGKVLSADVINVTGSGTSVEKGESLYNTALTLQAMNADIIVVRHPDAGAPHFLARHLDSSVINAGDGTHAHPTQALLDLYTLRSRLGRLKGLKVAIVGDILHSRVARSNLWGLTAVGANVVLCGPPTLMPIDLMNGERTAEGHPFAAAVMVLRIQSERQRGGFLPSLREYSRMYGINAKRMELAKPEALVMHPGPMNEGVEIDSEVAHGPRSVIEEQVANGVAVRMALMFGIITPALVPARSRN